MSFSLVEFFILYIIVGTAFGLWLHHYTGGWDAPGQRRLFWIAVVLWPMGMIAAVITIFMMRKEGS